MESENGICAVAINIVGKPEANDLFARLIEKSCVRALAP